MPEPIQTIENSPDSKSPPPFLVNEHHTVRAIQRAEGSGYFEEPDVDSRNGYFQGRPIIGRDTPINGGVYLGGGQREAVVVDDTKSPYLDNVYSDLIRETESDRQNGRFKSAILTRVFDKARQVLPYDLSKTEQIAAPYSNDNKVSLDVFIANKVGVCRHQALLTAYLIERLKKDGYVRGTASIDRNSIAGKGGHAWVRYTNSGGEVYIIDPAQNFIGKLDHITSEQGRWFYQRT